MKAPTNRIKVLLVLLCVLPALAPVAQGATITFDSNVSVNSNLVVIGTLSTTNLIPNQANISISIAGGASDGTTNAGDVVISGGGGGYLANGGNVFLKGGRNGYQDTAGSVMLQGGASTYGSQGGDVILKNNDNNFYTTGDTYGGHVRLQTSDGTTRFWLQQNGTLNLSGNYIAYARIVPQGDLSMGSFTNSP
jgi:hypothetical protein